MAETLLVALLMGAFFGALNWAVMEAKSKDDDS